MCLYISSLCYQDDCEPDLLMQSQPPSLLPALSGGTQRSDRASRGSSIVSETASFVSSPPELGFASEGLVPESPIPSLAPSPRMSAKLHHLQQQLRQLQQQQKPEKKELEKKHELPSADSEPSPHQRREKQLARPRKVISRRRRSRTEPQVKKESKEAVQPPGDSSGEETEEDEFLGGAGRKKTLSLPLVVLLLNKHGTEFNRFVSFAQELVGYTGCEKQLTALVRTSAWFECTVYSSTIALADPLTLRTLTANYNHAASVEYAKAFKNANGSGSHRRQSLFLALALTPKGETCVLDAWEYVSKTFLSEGIASGPLAAFMCSGSVGTLFRKMCGLKYRKMSISILGVPGQQFQRIMWNKEWNSVADSLAKLV